MVSITEKASKELLKFMQDNNFTPESHVFRVGVKGGGGCGELSYMITFDSAEKCDQSRDEVNTQYGIRVAVDKVSLMNLDGTVIDYYDGLDKRGFSFENPNATRSCGCGNSFQTGSCGKKCS